ncbi:fibronectin type III domain-containing protein [Actinocatenispora rupis]|uniref:Fibronectin type-III domain-containing protein n=1 Tax=Actinocatenispora rupis TaxID=519421 RepID=A0A8J3ND85_9ACTN|nr:fibronectin type III domain-containing protein [Actinocatenispora rupis]GID14811.1 hypothetical protein Aru02nite_57000 [Actinocatenispora rupis]
MRRGGTGEPRAHRTGPSRRSGGFISIGLVLALSVGLVGTVLGVGATSRSLDVADGNIWLWSSKPAQVSRVNANSGRVDVNQPLLDSRGHHVEVTQNDKYLLLHDLDAGKVTSVDLTRMGFTGSLQVPKGAGVRVALSGDKAALIDQAKGQVRGFDPATLRTTQATVQLPAPLAGGDFDSSGHLWLGVPSQGTVVSVTVSAASARVARTESVTAPDHPMVVTVLDHGVLAADTSGRDIAVVTDTVTTLTAPQPLTGVTAPGRTVGDLAVLTQPRTGRVMPVSLGKGAKPAVFALPSGVSPGAATPFAGRIYVPDAKRHLVYVFDSRGKSLGTLGLAGATGPLELEVREGHLMINAPDSSVARVVDDDGVTRIVDKYRSDVPGGDGDLSVIAAPAPGNQGKDTKKPSPGDQGKAQDGPPGPPIPVTALAASHRVTLSWPQPAENGAPVQRYDVSWDGGHRRVAAGTRSLVVTGLHNGRTYSFGVTATNKFGTGPTALSDQVTPGGKTPDVPQGVRAVVNKDGTVGVSWGAADQARDYVVQPSNGGQAATVTGTSATFDTLTGGQSYTFTVVARSSGGIASRPSAPSNAVTPFTAPGAPAVSVGNTTKDSITVNWQAAPDNGSPVTRYYAQLNNGTPAKANGTSHTFTGLQPATQYTITVWAENKAGPGEKQTVTATSGKPAPPTVSVSVTGRDTTSITVSVQASQSATNCTVAVQGGASQACAAGTSSHTFSGLAPSSDYAFTATVTDAYQQQASGSANGSTQVVSTSNACTNAADGCTVGIYSGPWQNQNGSSKVGEWAQGASVNIQCRTTGQSIYAYNQNGYRRSDVWLKIPGRGYVPWSYSDMSEGTRDSLPTC